MTKSAQRLFIGIMADKEAQEAIAAYQMQWRWPTTARLVAPDRLHMTLAFLGNVDRQDEQGIRSVLRDVPVTPLSVRLTFAESFRGGIAVLRADPSIALSDLRASVQEKIQSLGLPVDTRPRQPHVTLARAAEGCQPPLGPPSVEMRVLQFSLVCSHADRAHGYEVIESWPAF